MWVNARADNGSHFVTQSQTMACVDQDYSRIMTSLRLLRSVQSGILDMAHAVYTGYFYSTYNKSSRIV